MKITETQVRRIMIKAQSDRVKEFVQSFNDWNETFGINTPLRVAHYIAQVAHETGELKWLEELSSGRRYEGRKDLGNTKPGDGVRFKGRGLLQTTGRNNYQAYANSVYCNGDLMSHPEWLARFPGAQKASMYYWKSRGLNAVADKDDVRGVTKRINGGFSHFQERVIYTNLAKSVFRV